MLCACLLLMAEIIAMLFSQACAREDTRRNVFIVGKYDYIAVASDMHIHFDECAYSCLGKYDRP